MRPKLGKNNQQWIFDYLIKATGSSAHWEYSSGVFPVEVKQWDMIHKAVGKHAARQEELARRAEEAGHFGTACELYNRATAHYYDAQHTICEDGNPEKIRMYERLLHCNEKARKYTGTVGANRPVAGANCAWTGSGRYR